MKTRLCQAITIFITLMISLMTNAGEQLSLSQLTQLLSDPNRPAADAKRDPARKPAQIMHFSDIAEGDHILDLFAGAGWYSELFAMAVGEQGKVYAQNDSVIWQFVKEGMEQRTKANRLANVTRLDNTEIADMPIAEGSIDLVFTALNYHDLFFTHSVRDGKTVTVREKPVDHKAALAKIKRVLKDDGVFVIIDHVGVAGSGFNAPNDAHRIDPNIVKYQMAEAGFTLVEEAFYLRNDQDDLTSHVFAQGVRGKTDRFIYKYVKSSYE